MLARDRRCPPVAQGRIQKLPAAGAMPAVVEAHVRMPAAISTRRMIRRQMPEVASCLQAQLRCKLCSLSDQSLTCCGGHACPASWPADQTAEGRRVQLGAPDSMRPTAVVCMRSAALAWRACITLPLCRSCCCSNLHSRISCWSHTDGGMCRQPSGGAPSCQARTHTRARHVGTLKHLTAAVDDACEMAACGRQRMVGNLSARRLQKLGLHHVH